MADWQRRRHPRSDFVQDGISPTVFQQIGQWQSAFAEQASSFTTPKRPQRHPGYQTEPQAAPAIFAVLPLAALLTPAAFPFYERTLKRRQVYDKGVTEEWANTQAPPAFTPAVMLPAYQTPFWGRMQYRKGRSPKPFGGGPPPAAAFDVRLVAGTAAFFPPTPKRRQAYDRGVVEDVAVPLRPAVELPANIAFWTTPPKRGQLFPSSPAQDGAWIWFIAMQVVNAGVGGGFSPPVSPWQVQYMDLAQPVFGGPASTATPVIDVAPLTTLHLPGPVLQYDDFVQPLIAPPNVIIPVPEGVAAYITNYPQPYRLRRLPEMGTILALQVPFYPSGSALSWVPVYEGKAGLPPSIHPSGPPAQFATIIIPPAPASAATYGAEYPDRVGREPGRGYPNYGPSITWTPIPITPPAPPTQHKHVDLRRRELLLIRRLIS